MAYQIQRRLVETIRESPFSIIADETTDLSTKEQLCIAVRYVGYSDDHIPIIEERFLSFTKMESVTGQAIADAILSQMSDLGLDMRHCRGQAYDGASNMSGAINGCAAIITRHYPLTTYTHCRSHVLNLTLMKTATSLPEISHMWCVQSELSAFFANSAKRTSELESRINGADAERRKTHIPSLSQTRWTERYAALENTMDLLPDVCSYMESMIEDRTVSSESRGKALSLLKSLQSFDFIIALCISNSIISCTNTLCTKLQGRALDVALASEAIDSVRKTLSTYQKDVMRYHSTWYKATLKLADAVGVEAQTPRRAARSKYRANVEASSTEDYYRICLTIPLLEKLNEEFNARFVAGDRMCELLLLIPSCLLAPMWRHRIDLKDRIMVAVEPYKGDLGGEVYKLESDVEVWIDYWRDREIYEDSITTSAVTALKTAESLSLTTISALLRIVCVLPITSNEAERSFSRLKIIKTALRTTMTNKRLNSLAMLSTNRDLDVNVTSVAVNMLAKRKRLKVVKRLRKQARAVNSKRLKD